MRRAAVFKALYPLETKHWSGESGPVVRPGCAAAHLMNVTS